MSGEPVLVRLGADTEIKGPGTLLQGGEQGLPEQDLSRRVAGAVDGVVRHLADGAAAVAEPVLKSDGATVPVDPDEPQPAGAGHGPGEAFQDQARLAVQKPAGVRRGGP